MVSSEVEWAKESRAPDPEAPCGGSLGVVGPRASLGLWARGIWYRCRFARLVFLCFLSSSEKPPWPWWVWPVHSCSAGTGAALGSLQMVGAGCGRSRALQKECLEELRGGPYWGLKCLGSASMLQGQTALGRGSRNPDGIGRGRVGPGEAPLSFEALCGNTAGQEGDLRVLQAPGFNAHLGTELGLFVADGTTGNLETSLAGLVDLE